MADMLWTADELKRVLGANVSGALPDGANGVSIDTRTLQSGDLFVAIKGDRTDGHHYLEQAFEAGAALAIVDDGFDGAASGPILRVDNAFEALNKLGKAGRARSTARIIAVTGSVGKTGTKEMLRLMLAQLGNVHASDKSYNNHWGVPLSLARLPRYSDFAVFEIGMNHAGEITPLTKMVRPHAAIITTIAPVHIEFFDGIDGIAEAKAEIFAGIEPGGAAILNRDNAQFDLLAKRAGESGIETIIAFGRSEDTQFRLTSLRAENGGSLVEAEGMDGALSYKIGAPGEHLAMNSLAALAAIRMVGGDVARASSALEAFGAPAGRGAQTRHQIDGGALLLIDEAYNANPASMDAALKVLGAVASPAPHRRIAVLGDMLELGAQSRPLHAALATSIEANGIDLVFCSGPEMAALYEALPNQKRGLWTEDSAALETPLLDALRPADIITIKGSLGSRMGPLVEAIKTRFPHCAPETKTAAA